jgi:phosphoglycolate phosphatase-like HAD superfamily hydrolase
MMRIPTVQYSNKFSELVVNKVINAEWVPGVVQVLRANFFEQKFVLISATPDDELKFIVESLNLTNCFDLIFGSSISKSDAMLKSLNLLNENPKNCLMIGDALADYEASKNNNIVDLAKSLYPGAFTIKLFTTVTQ